MKIAIIDDLKTDREKASFYLHKFFTEQNPPITLEIDHYENGETFISQFTANTYQVVLIDYYMEKMSGLELAKAIRKSDAFAALIFTTVSQEYAIAGYTVRASGYLVKPFTYSELAELLSLLELETMHLQDYIELVNGYRTCRILLETIAYCDISGHYAQVHTLDKTMERTRMTFHELTQLLSPYPQFLCCYRGCIVNMDNIESLDDFCFIMSNSERIPIRLKARNKILQTYSDYVFAKTRKKSLWIPH